MLKNAKEWKETPKRPKSVKTKTLKPAHVDIPIGQDEIGDPKDLTAQEDRLNEEPDEVSDFETSPQTENKSEKDTLNDENLEQAPVFGSNWSDEPQVGENFNQNDQPIELSSLHKPNSLASHERQKLNDIFIADVDI